jgi:hypothetical protein
MKKRAIDEHTRQLSAAQLALKQRGEWPQSAIVAHTVIFAISSLGADQYRQRHQQSYCGSSTLSLPSVLMAAG